MEKLCKATKMIMKILIIIFTLVVIRAFMGMHEDEAILQSGTYTVGEGNMLVGFYTVSSAFGGGSRVIVTKTDGSKRSFDFSLATTKLKFQKGDIIEIIENPVLFKAYE